MIDQPKKECIHELLQSRSASGCTPFLRAVDKGEGFALGECSSPVESPRRAPDRLILVSIYLGCYTLYKEYKPPTAERSDAMAVSYSFHISSKSHAVTNTGKVGQVSKHNLREYKSASYDKSQIEVLVGSSDNLLNDIKRVYHQEFDEALEQYNQKQKRADRK